MNTSRYMDADNNKPNLTLSVPFFMVTNMEVSLRFYVDGLGFEMKHHWIPRGHIEWCYLQREKVAIMLQEIRRDITPSFPEGKKGHGVSTVIFCEDALAIYREVTAKGLKPGEPFVGNNLWVVTLRDPDDYCILFESSTDVPEETTLSQWVTH